MSTDIFPPCPSSLAAYRAEVQSAKARLGLAHRKAVAASDEVKANARCDLTAANIKAYIAEQVGKAPPLSPAQRESIIALLSNGGGSDD